MTHKYLAAAIVFAALGVSGEALAQAQRQPPLTCLEGRTASGQCVDAGLAATLSQIATIFSQPMISGTAYPVMPSDDAKFRYPDQVIGPQGQNKPASNSNW